MPQAQLPVDELHLWTLSYDPLDEKLFEAVKELLPREELQRFQRIKFPKPRAERIVSQAALRVLLACYKGGVSEQIGLARSSKGKPWCRDASDIGFNMSHSEGVTAIGFARYQEIGVDLERIRDMKDLEGLIRKNLKSGEVEQLGKEFQERRRNFFRFWTFKESYLKAVGEGMRLSPEKLEFRIRKRGVDLVVAPYPFGEEGPIFREFFPDEAYTGTLTFQDQGTRIVEKELKPDTLIRWGQEQANGADEDL